ncbi:helix-turn-helix domain-containing protein [Thioclava sp. GXIMD4215]|uniref:helix-turn-helix domain-containing protein n=1 Tax=Thioclava sp. GXIMD4215 TaxID=3131928 RepID=UPI0032508F4A
MDAQSEHDFQIATERTDSATHPVDLRVGRQIRRQRWLLGMTQRQLADQIGVRFQQVQKYETGANRVSASRLWMMSQALGLDIHRFFEPGAAEDDSDEAFAWRDSKECVQLVGIFLDLSADRKTALLNLAKSLAT